MSLAAPLRLLSVVFALALAAAPGPAVPDDGVPVERARAFVAELGGEVVAALQSGRPLAEREVALRDVFLRGFDIDTIGRFVLGRYWRLATPEQQAAYLDVYRWQVEHIEQAVREADAGDFASEQEVAEAFARWRK